MSWIAVRVWPESEAREAMIASFFALGSSGVLEEGDALLTCFPSETSREELARSIGSHRLLRRPEISLVENEDWTERWRESVRPHRVGALTVAPPWRVERGERERTIVIDPGMAFGTGEHASTRTALLLLQRHLVRGDAVADLGAGSGVLAIAAALLGARRVAAIELDMDAMENLQRNIDANEVGDRVAALFGSAEVLLPLVAPVELVVANIIASTILELLATVGRALTGKGTAVVAGVLASERSEFERMVNAAGWAVIDSALEDSWCALALRPR